MLFNELKNFFFFRGKCYLVNGQLIMLIVVWIIMFLIISFSIKENMSYLYIDKQFNARIRLAIEEKALRNHSRLLDNQYF